MSDDENRERIEVMVATYQDAWLDLIRLGVVLVESGRDLTGMKETIDGLGGTEAKELLLVAAATAAVDNIEKRRRSSLN